MKKSCVIIAGMKPAWLLLTRLFLTEIVTGNLLSGMTSSL